MLRWCCWKAKNFKVKKFENVINVNFGFDFKLYYVIVKVSTPRVYVVNPATSLFKTSADVTDGSF